MNPKYSSPEKIAAEAASIVDRMKLGHRTPVPTFWLEIGFVDRSIDIISPQQLRFETEPTPSSQ